MSEGREGRRFFVSFIKKRKEGASCFGSFRKEHLGVSFDSLDNGPKDLYSSSHKYICIQMRDKIWHRKM